MLQRVGYQARMHKANSHENSSGMVSCSENDAGYISNADRFHSDTCGEELIKRQEILLRFINVIIYIIYLYLNIIL